MTMAVGGLHCGGAEEAINAPGMARVGVLSHFLLLFLSCGLIPYAAGQPANELFARAFERLQEGDAELAIGLFRKGLEQDPDNGTAHFYLGMALERRNPPEATAAVTHFRRAAGLLQGKPDGIEAAMRADRLEAQRIRTSLVANPALLNGRWCYSNQVGSGSMTINGNDVSLEQGGGSSSGSIKILSESRFLLTVRSLFSTNEYINELSSPDVIQGIGADGKPVTNVSPARRC